MNSNRLASYVLFLVFALSGFSGLIYESVWTHYLKLFLGHAAYAQTLVLAIFMGGMAIGSMVASRYSGRLSNLLMGYAVVEGLIGVAALVFHKLFVGMTDFAFESVMPNLSSPLAVQTFKWSLSTAFILPQSILLGMTFPLMSAGIIRRFSLHPGASLGVLYFSNSLGAAIGVLVSGFGLIAWVGLPGTIMTAGLINLILALIVWGMTKGDHYPVAMPETSEPVRTGSLQQFLFLAAAITGLASFFYEIGWIRMLSMVLGSSTHAFELMLSAFILGLALGGYWIKNRIEHLSDPLRFLGWVQVVMGMLALSTLSLYGNTFEIMSFVMRAFARTAAGYDGFHLASHSIALLVMLPTTFCAGMTLPLMTYVLLKHGSGEKVIGGVYAANTIGAIIGVFAAVHLVMPVLGLKGVISIGAIFDFALGLALLRRGIAANVSRKFRLAAVAGISAVVATLVWVKIDPYRIVSSVYRTGSSRFGQENQILYLRDGKTATVSLLKAPSGTIAIATNGKTDAAINMGQGTLSPDEPTPDEGTMVMAGAVPLSLHPKAQTAANIGLGSGLTSHVLLATQQLKVLDTIEIEPNMVEAARIGFGPRVQRVFSDPRSKIHIEDAKTFFSTTGRQYDIIVSEPSNPWVSGVASLFSEQFYRTVVRHLNADGLLVQWIQIYETEPAVVASIVKALSPHFSDYAIYCTDNANILLVARKSGGVGTPSREILALPGLEKELRRVQILGREDIENRRLGGQGTLNPLFQSFAAPRNSDFFPFVDLNAPRSRFMEANSVELTSMGMAPLPVLEMLEGNASFRAQTLTGNYPYFEKDGAIHRSIILRAAIMEKQYDKLPAEVEKDLAILESIAADCSFKNRTAAAIDALFNVGTVTTPFLTPRELDGMWKRLGVARCNDSAPKKFALWVTLLQASGDRDGTLMAKSAGELLEMDYSLENEKHQTYLLKAAMLGNLAIKQPQAALDVWKKYGTRVLRGTPPDMVISQMILLSQMRARRTD